MKTVRAIYLLLIAVCFLFSAGCGDGGSSAQQVSKLESQVRKLNTQVSELREENKKLKKERDEAESVAKSRYITLSIFAYTALGIAILLIGGFVFMVRPIKRAPAKMSNDSLHCPRCGWEHRPEETVCKNCKTHF